MHRLPVLTALFLSATMAFAHGGVKNPAVMARMDVMADIGATTKVLGEMAKGAQPFDADKARIARAALREATDQVAVRFKAREGDPKSEARPEIWTDWAGFIARTEDMRAAAEALDVSSLERLRAGMGAVGRSCSGCHEDYRIKK